MLEKFRHSQWHEKHPVLDTVGHIVLSVALIGLAVAGFCAIIMTVFPDL